MLDKRFNKSEAAIELNFKTDILFLLSAISILGACVNERTDVEKVTKDLEYPAESTFESRILYTENAELKVMAYAPEMHRYSGEKEYSEMPKGVEVVFYDSLKNESSKLTARYAIDLQSVFLMEARNDVVITNSLGEKLNTEHLIWDRKAQRIYSDVFVKITTADEVIMGEGFESNETFTRYRILKPRGTIEEEIDE